MKYIVYLLTIVLPVNKRVAGDRHVRVSAVQCTSASARKTIELLERETSDFISPDLWSPTALTKALGAHATAGLSEDVQERG